MTAKLASPIETLHKAAEGRGKGEALSPFLLGVGTTMEGAPEPSMGEGASG